MDYKTLMEGLSAYPEEMTNAERMAAYANGDEVDHVPYALTLGETAAPLYGYTVRQYNQSFDARRAELEFIRTNPELGEGKSATVSIGLRGIGAALGSTIKYPENSVDYVTDFVLTDYDMLPEMYTKFDPKTNEFLSQKTALVRQYKKECGNNFPVTLGVVGPLSTAAAIRKPELLMRDMLKNKAKVHELLDLSVHCSLKWLEAVIEELGPATASFSDPVSSMYLISERQFQEFCVPHLQDLLAGFKRLTGKIPGVHICGKTKPIWSYLSDLGMPSFSVDNCEDLQELKEAVGDRMMILGNVPPVDVLKNGTIDDVIHSVQQCLIKCSDSPMGYMLAVGCQIPVGTPIENLRAYVYAARRYGRGAKKGQLCRGLIEEGLV